MNGKSTIAVMAAVLSLSACAGSDSQETRDRQAVDQQQSQYAIAQPLPTFDWSLERELLIELYRIRNENVATHSVWRSDFGAIEGDCPSMGYGLPYTSSLTNPFMATSEDQNGIDAGAGGLTTIGQPEPNGIFASTNSSATWVMCIGSSGALEPVFVETKVTVYPGPVNVDYDTNRVTRTGAASVTVTVTRPAGAATVVPGE